MITITQKWQKIDLDKGVTLEIRPMNLGAYHRALALMMKHQPEQKPGDEEKKEKDKGFSKMSNSLMRDPDVVPIIQEIVPPHSRNLKGIKFEDEDANIRDGTVNDLVNEGACIGMALTALAKLIEISQLKEAEAKN